MLRRGIWRTLARWFARAEALERGASELARQVELDAGRRRFLQATSAGTLAVGLGGLGALSACRTSPDRARASGPVDDRRPEVAILGAGLAGMTCLHRLTQRGMRAVVYEQSERLGGRTWTGRGLFAGGPGGDDPGHMLELGGEFIDTAHVEMLKLAKELGLAVRDTLAASAAPADPSASTSWAASGSARSTCSPASCRSPRPSARPGRPSPARTSATSRRRRRPSATTG
ncbi:MAG: FAD-dependent oxidoreductase [Myxococcota bacterium]